ncbi:cell wall-binding repeat-containing protein [Herbiconiux sp.]|uniref:cell wall-binding repeat-containing protein n=1 Tax=Herbiconiux sp. TaxID=1871186 RepID=UPI0025BB74ED|nr:cell wall-binding repeat-containing protein [Herbiconiux sp.]
MKSLPSICAAALGALLLAASAAGAVAPASALTPPVVSRVQGTDRYDQAVQVSKEAFTTANTVYLASGEKFSDALSAGSVAGLHNAPLLLTPAAVLTAGTLAELQRLNPDHIVIVGGANSVNESVADKLVEKIPDAAVTRIGGADRFEVSRALVTNPDFGVPSSPWVYLASGSNFPDALAASPAAVTVNGPVVLVNGAETALTTAEAQLFDDLAVKNVRIAGGPASVSAALQASLTEHYTVTRASGADRFEAAAAINKEAFTASTTVYLASGLVFPDALSAAPVAGRDGNPIYLVQKDCVPAPVLAELQRLTPAKVVILGGTNTISKAVESLTSC